MTARQLIDELERRGVRLRLEGGDLRYRAPKGALSAELRGAIAEHKQDILDLLRQRAAPAGPAAHPWFQIKNESVGELFERQVRRTPTHPALAFDGQTLTYEQLNERANRLAHCLISLGVGPEVAVPVFLERGIDLIVALLAILKAGGAYVPLDTSYPEERLQLLLDEVGGPVLVTTQRLADLLPSVAGGEVKRAIGSPSRRICLDSDHERIAAYDEGNPPSTATGANLAYVIFTSGSTGKPKGVRVSHRAISRLVYQTNYVTLGPSDRVAQASTVTFDAATFEIWGALVNGARLVGCPKEVLLSPTELAAHLREHSISTLFVTTALFNRLASEAPEAFAPLRNLLFGGEAVNPDWVREVLRKSAPERLLHVYGPTEATTFATWYLVESVAEDAVTVPIGGPISNTQTYLLDKEFNPVPAGVGGELHIGGPGLARDYVNSPELTAAKFVPHALTSEPGARLYKTGDQCRWSKNGAIEFGGRIDHQVKIRGYRIEPGEIESVLRELSGVRDAVVLAREDTPGDKRLVGYLVPDKEWRPPSDGGSSLQESSTNGVSRWQEIYDHVIYRDVGGASTAADPTFNISGWDSTFTGESLGAASMREQVERTVERILALKPRRVLEIGCGTGLLMFRLAPRCEKYTGTDFSQVALDYTAELVKKQNLRGVTLLNRMANDFTDMEEGMFDAVVLNSVVQYFPSIEYLIEVLEGAVRILEPGGFVFLGDVRNYRLLEALHASVQLHRSDAGDSCERIAQRARHEASAEQELLVDPAFFTALKRQLPEIEHAEVQLKRGRHHHELTQFRYDVTLHVGQVLERPTEQVWLDWQRDHLTLDALPRRLSENGAEAIGITGIPNRRVLTSVRTLERLSRPNGAATAADLREEVRIASQDAGVDPEDLWELEGRLPYAVSINWSASADDRFDALLRRRSGDGSFDRRKFAAFFPNGDGANRPWGDYATKPQDALVAQLLLPEVRRSLGEKLPDYMVPSVFVILETFPLNAHGKVDRRALPAPEATRRDLQNAYVAPGSEAEVALARIWSEILGVDDVGVNDNFFELGGDSILAIQVISRANQQAGLTITARDLFQHQSIAELAAVAGRGTGVQAEQGIVLGDVPLTPIQRWFFEQQLAEPNHFNQAFFLEVRQPLDTFIIGRTLRELVIVHHDAFRLRYVPGPKDMRQFHASVAEADATFGLRVIDLTNLTEGQSKAALESTASGFQASLDLATGPLVRVALFKLRDRSDRLLIVAHHLAVDAVSWRILMEDFQSAYLQFSRAQAVALPPKTTSFKQWAERLAEYAVSQELRKESDYWLAATRLQAAPLPVDRAGGANTVAEADSVTTVLSQEETEALVQEVHRAYRTQMNEVLLTPLLLTFVRWTGGRRLLVDLEAHGREPLFDDLDVSRTVGWFTSMAPVELDLGEAQSPGDALKRVKEQLRGVPDHGIGYGLLRYLSEDAEIVSRLEALPQAEIAFNYLGRRDQGLPEGAPFALAPESSGPLQSPRGTRRHLLTVNSVIAGGQLRLSWTYSRQVHHRETIEKLASGYMDHLRQLIAHCRSPEVWEVTPSDFPEFHWSPSELDRITAAIRKTIGGLPGGPSQRVQDFYPLSPMQEGLLFHSLYAAESSLYFEQLRCTLEGSLDLTAFRRTWQEVVNRHDALRTSFVWEGVEEPVQVVHARLNLSWQELDFRGAAPDEQRRRLEDFLEEDRRQGFNLARAPLMRVAVVRLAEDRNHLVWSFHHALLDGWSLANIMKEALAYYEVFRQGRSLALPLGRPYRDYIGWLKRQDLEEAEAYWRKRLAGFRAPIRTRLEREITDVSGDPVGSCRASLSKTTTEALQSLSGRNGLSVNTCLQGAWAIALSQYSGEEDIVFGAVSSGRPAELRDVESMVGLFVNTLPVRALVRPHEPLIPWLKTLQDQATKARQFEYSPLMQVQRWSDVAAGRPLFECSLAFENYLVDSSLRNPNFALKIGDLELFERSNHGFGLMVAPGEELGLRLLYDRRRYHEAIGGLASQVKTLLESFVRNPDQILGELSLLTPVERHQLLVEWNGATVPESTQASIGCLFTAQAERTPDAVALVSRDMHLSYRELDSRAERLSFYLQALGVGPEIPVGLSMNRSPEMVVGLLGTLKAGGASVPVSPANARRQLKEVSSETRDRPGDSSKRGPEVRVLLTQRGLAESVSGSSTVHERDLVTSATTVCLDSEWSSIAGRDGENPHREASPANLAFLCHGSGSIDPPPPTLLTHQGVCHLGLDFTRRLDVGNGDHVLQASPPGSSESVLEIISTLFGGASLHLLDTESLPLVSELTSFLDRRCVTVATLPASILSELPLETLYSVKTVVSTGETLPARMVSGVKGGGRRIHAYRATEATSLVTTFEWEITGNGGPTVSRRNMPVHVLHRDLALVPVGVVGELHVSGLGLPRGYVGQPARTSETFIPDPFSDQPGSRMFKTGDLCRWLTDGDIEIVRQPGLTARSRGSRAGRGDGEAALDEQPNVRDASVEDRVLRARAVARRLPGEELDELLPRTNLTKNQLLVWAGQKLQPSVPFYNIGVVLAVDGHVEHEHLERAFQSVLDASDALRTVIEERDGIPQQKVLPPFMYRMESVDFSMEPDAQAALAAWTRQRCEMTFDLGQPLFESTFVKTSEKEFAWFIRQHHIISDAWSFGLIIRQVEELYRRSLAGDLRPSVELPAYADFVEFERQKRDTDAYHLAKEYWQRKLEEVTAPVEFYGRESHRRSNRVQRVSCELGGQRSAKVVELAASEGFSRSSANLSRFAVFGTALLTYLYRISGNRVLSLGTTLLNRPTRKFKETVGMFVQMACLRVQISDGDTFRSLAQKLMAEMREAMRYRIYATGNSPQRQLFDVLINYETVEFQRFNGVPCYGRSVYKGYGDEALALLVRDYSSSGSFSFDFDFRSDVFGEAQRTLAMGHFLNVVDALLDDSDRMLDSMSLLSPRERQTILSGFNSTDAPLPEEQTLLHVLQEQVARVPDKIACTHEAHALSYRELDLVTNRMAEYMRSVGVGPDVVVAILAHRSIDFLTAVLSVFKAGGAYLPLDPVDPSKRFTQVIGQSGVEWILCSREFRSRVASEVDGMASVDRPTVLCIEELRQLGRSKDCLPIQCRPGNSSYVIYTSGSTGAPKGAMVEHVGMLNHLIAKIEDLRLTSSDGVAQTASQCFDISVWQFLAILMVGGRLEIVTEEATHDPSLLLELMDREGITVFETVPTMLRAMLERATRGRSVRPSLSTLRWMIVTGEALPTELCRSWLELYPDIPMLNAYGPTECSDDVTHHVINRAPAQDVVQTPIGRPVRNMRLFSVDRSGMLLPVGAIGELLVAGVGVGRGYLHDPRRTAEVFLPDPFASDPGSRLYRTGDRGRYRPDGVLEFLGRLDHQVKVRGFRIELGEIEAVLEEHPAVRGAVVLAPDEGPGGKRLVAYVVPAEGAHPSSSELRLHIKGRLPSYMVPAAFVLLEAFPVLPSGKVDRRSLPPPAQSQLGLQQDYVAPRTPEEQELCRIWSEVLGVERVGVRDDFFELGGHSLSALRLMSRIHEAFDVDVALPEMFENPTVAGLAEAIERARRAEAPSRSVSLDLASEVVLDPTIVPSGASFEFQPSPKRVLLTGATGFLGAFLLHDLLRATGADVYCLVRASDPVAARLRLRSSLESYELWDETLASRILPLLGDLGQPLLGLTDERFEQLAGEIDVIYHNGAWVSAFYPYATLKPTNVLGTQEVLRLAGQVKVKAVHYVSTVSVLGASGYPPGHVIREQDPLDSNTDLDIGYSQSKWVAEKLVAIAQTRGFPISVYRPGRISGHSRTGVSNTDDLPSRLMKGCIELGSVPDIDMEAPMDMTPVDYVSRAIVELSLREPSLGLYFHLVNPRPLAFKTMVDWICSRGYDIRKVSLSQWRDEVVRFGGLTPDNVFAPLLPVLSALLSHEGAESALAAEVPRIDQANTAAGLRGTSVACPVADTNLLDTYFDFFLRSGFLVPPPARTVDH